jgi:hypothetical protein
MWAESETSQETDEDQPRILWLDWYWRAVLILGLYSAVAIGISLLVVACNANRQANEALNLIMPILSMIGLIIIGWWAIWQNHCGPFVQFTQNIVLFGAAIWLALIDCMVLLLLESPLRQQPLTLVDVAVFAGVFSVYGLVMLFVIYPGREW